MKLRNILIIQAIIVLFIGIGWVKNLIKLAHCDFEAPYQAEVIYAAGLIPPVGAITGWLDLGK
ncbi:MAG: hypothetical protein GXP46_01725 [Deferribacteres bacterium]|nr:hypothetical protein [Deferribacteres bacterium]